ncbi:hypothetical protein [Cryptosporangium phraense]|uniref:DUF998 domain-containing protein n=1 Tax=Cryptosporangium phraense TaxID=2593070 RepID=A0A545AM12_9ACTN|nr:hypothetical protein [Cryptosporangium phraense]TQS42358.1 hypothetical protein FL583_23875 [Cryptosporangium phraense]
MFVPVAALWVLAPYAAECSWGGFALTDYPAVILFLGPLYGGAAVLIRETVRRIGGGWPAIVLLAAAFGVYMAGLVDQSLFNLDYLDDTEFAGMMDDPRDTLVPWVGVSLGDALNFVGNHVALSMCAPIAVIESFVRPARRTEPWLGRWGLGVVFVLFVLGSLLIHADAAKGFGAAPHQLGIAVVTAGALVAAALLIGRRTAGRAAALDGDAVLDGPAALDGDGNGDGDGDGAGQRRAPGAVWVGVVTLAAAACPGLAPGWAGPAIYVAAIVTASVIVVRWSRRPGWGQQHVLAAWSGPLVLAAGTAYLVPNYAPASPAQALVGDLAITVITLSLVIGAAIAARPAKIGVWRRSG